MKINEYLKKHYKFNDKLGMSSIAPKIICVDGFTVSVQASEYHYCSPRENNAFPYFEVEIGFPSAKEETLMPFIDEAENNPTDSVYAYVPVEIVDEIISRHGGIKENN